MSHFISRLVSKPGIVTLAALTAVFLAVSGILGNGHTGVRGMVADIAWFGFLISALATVLAIVASVIRSRRHGATVAVVALALVSSGGLLAHASAAGSTSSSTASMRMTVPLAKQVTHETDVAPKGPSGGDGLQGTGPVLSTTGTRVGTIDLVALGVTGHRAVVQAVLHLKHGEIDLMGSTTDIDNCSLAVIGGTGRYAHVHGVATIKTAVSSSNARLTLTIS